MVTINKRTATASGLNYSVCGCFKHIGNVVILPFNLFKYTIIILEFINFQYISFFWNIKD